MDEWGDKSRSQEQDKLDILGNAELVVVCVCVCVCVCVRMYCWPIDATLLLELLKKKVLIFFFPFLSFFFIHLPIDSKPSGLRIH